MHILILMIALSLTACKTENQILGRPFIAPIEEKKAEENVETKLEKKLELQISTKPYQVIAFEKGQSVLREKLIAQVINQHLEKKSSKFNAETITINDELALKNKSQSLTDFELKEFLEKSTKEARVIVTFSDHIQVFFVPAGLAKDQLINLLALKAEQNNKLNMINTTDELTTAGNAYYMLSTNKQELIDFDNLHFTKVEEFASFSNSIHLKLNKNQKVQGTLSYNYYVENTVSKDFTAPKVRCFKSICSPCNFTREVPGASWIPSAIATTDDIGLSISANGMNYPLAIFGVQANEANRVNLAFKDVVSSHMQTYDLVISLNIRPIQKKMDAQFLGYQCGEDRELYSEITTLKTKADAKLTLKIYGHGDLLNDLTL